MCGNGQADNCQGLLEILGAMNLVKVTLKNGKIIEVLRREVHGLQKAGLLKKESKVESETKEEKATGETKDFPVTTKNVKGKRPRKV